MTPAVSIIVPVYNTEKYLRKCLDSIVRQTLKDIEIVVINDGSKDNSGEICDEYAVKDKRIVVIHKSNGGPSSARNAGLERANGQWITFVDSDDYIERDLCEYLLDLAIDNNADLVQCGAFWEDRKEKRTVFTPTKDLVFEEGINSFEPATWRMMANANWGKLYLREVICDIRFDTRYFVGEDLNFNLLALEKAKRVVLGNEAKYHYIQSLGSLVRTAPSRDKLVNCRMMLCEIKKHFSGNEKMLKHVEDEVFRNDLDICSKIVEHRCDGVEDILQTVRKEVKKSLVYLLSSKAFSLAEKIKFVLIALFWPLYCVLLRASKA